MIYSQYALHPHPDCLDYVLQWRGEGPTLAVVLMADHYDLFFIRSIASQWTESELEIHTIVHFKDRHSRDTFLGTPS